MKKQVALGIAGASAALVGGWRLINQLVNRGEQASDGVAEAPGRPGAASTDGAGTDPEPATASKDMSKAELYEIAQDLGIEGRSKMTKDQLLRAIRQAG
ncbi:MAG TPA: Rho termination factor N-terminal domain-containing protein [Solirubrobacterales bacterium]|nr:Rho termination factor N-terminal domain-containing protein [Solirubrobacterales bacterium]